MLDILKFLHLFDVKLDDYKLSNYHLLLESSLMQIIAMIAFSVRQSSMNAFEKYVKLQGNLIGKFLKV